MTHEELLSKIEKQTIHIANKIRPVADTCEKEIGGFANALRAVVELHQPKGNFADTYINGEPNSPYCPECVDPDVYPCPTIQVIEKELQ